MDFNNLTREELEQYLTSIGSELPANPDHMVDMVKAHYNSISFNKQEKVTTILADMYIANNINFKYKVKFNLLELDKLTEKSVTTYSKLLSINPPSKERVIRVFRFLGLVEYNKYEFTNFPHSKFNIHLKGVEKDNTSTSESLNDLCSYLLKIADKLSSFLVLNAGSGGDAIIISDKFNRLSVFEPDTNRQNIIHNNFQVYKKDVIMLDKLERSDITYINLSNEVDIFKHTISKLNLKGLLDSFRSLFVIRSESCSLEEFTTRSNFYHCVKVGNFIVADTSGKKLDRYVPKVRGRYPINIPKDVITAFEGFKVMIVKG